MRIKIFKSNEGFTELQNKVNFWLEHHTVEEVVDIFYQDNNKYASIVILYKINK